MNDRELFWAPQLNDLINVLIQSPFLLISLVILPLIVYFILVNTKQYSKIDILRNRILLWVSVIFQVTLFFPIMYINKGDFLVANNAIYYTPPVFYYFYIISVYVWFIVGFIPLVSFPIIYFFSNDIIRRKGKLEPITSEYYNELGKIESYFSKYLRLFKGSIYTKYYLINDVFPQIYVFGRNLRNINVAISRGLLYSIREHIISEEELETIVTHEIGHISNLDLRIASSVKLFFDLKILKYSILLFCLLFIFLKLLYISFIFCFYITIPIYKNINNLALAISPSVVDFISIFLLLFVSYSIISLFINSTFRFRELLADKQAINILNSKSSLLGSLTKISNLFKEEEPLNRYNLGLSFLHILVLDPIILLNKLLDLILRKTSPTMRKAAAFINKIYETISFYYLSTHPRIEDRIELIKKYEYLGFEKTYSYYDYFVTGTIGFIFLYVNWRIYGYTIYIPPSNSYLSLVNLLILTGCVYSIIVVYINNSPLMTIKDNDTLRIIRKHVFNQMVLFGTSKEELRKITGSKEKVGYLRREIASIYYKNLFGFTPFILFPIVTFLSSKTLPLNVAIISIPLLIIFPSFLLYLYCWVITIRNRKYS